MFVLEMAKRCTAKSSALYNVLDKSNGFYKYAYYSQIKLPRIENMKVNV